MAKTTLKSKSSIKSKKSPAKKPGVKTAEKASVKTAKVKKISLASIPVKEVISSVTSHKVTSKLISIQEAMKSSNSIRMFKNPLVEKLSHVHPLTPIFLYVPVILASIYYYLLGEGSTLFSFLVYYLAGGFFWTLTEYTLHRFLFHPPFAETHLKWLYFYIHGVHHDAPNDATRLVMPPGASIPLAVICYFLFQVLIPFDYLAFFAGFVTGYLVYDFLHFATHFFAFEWNWFKKLRKHHGIHHFNTSRKNFGVSNSLWDYVFSTKYNGNN